jgi:hypothetical protein
MQNEQLYALDNLHVHGRRHPVGAIAGAAKTAFRSGTGACAKFEQAENPSRSRARRQATDPATGADDIE